MKAEPQRLREQIARVESSVKTISNALIIIEGAINRIEAKFGTETLSSHRTATAIQAAGWGNRSDVVTGMRSQDRWVSTGKYSPAIAEPIEQALTKLRDLDPVVFPIWQRLYENALTYYDPAQADQAASTSVWEHQYARIFGAYVSLFSSGRVLDIGSGSSALPSYLAGIPAGCISLLDPIEPTVSFPCEFAQGFNEFLPWGDSSFDTVISGTSLDHVLSLEKSLAEVVRVLTPQGRYVVWLASIPGSPPYEPSATDFQPRDQFHLFHFDRVWIEPVFARYFDTVDVTVIPQPGFDHVFYCLAPKSVPIGGANPQGHGSFKHGVAEE